MVFLTSNVEDQTLINQEQTSEIAVAEVPPATLNLSKSHKSFAMPGVIGLKNGEWVGGDYLGHISKTIYPEVEIIRGGAVTGLPENSELVNFVSNMLSKAGLIPRTAIGETIPLPLLHILLVVYPVDNDRYVIFGTCRLFEQVQVMRENWRPAGDWQGITWESLDVSLTPSTKVQENLEAVVNTLVTRFVERYQLYNAEATP